MGIRIPEFSKFLPWNVESLDLESGIQLEESGIPLTIGIRNSTDKDPGIQSTKRNTESKTALDCLTWGDIYLQ